MREREREREIDWLIDPLLAFSAIFNYICITLHHL